MPEGECLAPAMTTLNSPSERKRPPQRRRLFRFVALALGLCIALAIGEVAVRLIVGSPLAERMPLLIVRANAHRGYEMMPSTPHYTYQHLVRVNALGLRGPEVEAKKAGEVRIFALGDSMIYGQGVADDQTLPHWMQRTLDAASTGGAESFTVINGGVRGYGTNMELGMLRELGPAVDADVVILFWYWNDLMEFSIPEIDAMFTRTGPVVFETKTKLEGWAEIKWQVRSVIRKSALIMWLHDVVRGFSGPDLTPAKAERGLARLPDYLDEFRALAKERGATFLVAIVPDPTSLRSEHVSDAYRAKVATICIEKGIKMIDLLAAAKEADRGGYNLPTIPFDGHFNASANEVMGKAMARFVLEQEKAGSAIPGAPSRQGGASPRSRPPPAPPFRDGAPHPLRNQATALP
ncbi:MAG: SGNH/GDSL hydrolase family protein [Phycisphaeraceae bacterium]